jgi:hypothetical protein
VKRLSAVHPSCGTVEKWMLRIFVLSIYYI